MSEQRNNCRTGEIDQMTGTPTLHSGASGTISGDTWFTC